MDEHEIKNLKAKVALLQGIKDDDRMLTYTIQSEAKRMLTLLREANGRKEDGEGTKAGVNLNASEFDQLHRFMSMLESGSIGFMDSSAERYASAKKTKEEILKLL